MECCKNELKGLLPNWLVNMLSQSEGEKNITYPMQLCFVQQIRKKFKQYQVMNIL